METQDALGGAGRTMSPKGRVFSRRSNSGMPDYTKMRKTTSWRLVVSFIACSFSLLPLEVDGTSLTLTVSQEVAESPPVSQDPVWAIRHVLPALKVENNSFTDIRVNVGDTALLPCRFPQYTHHHESQVSWIRRWDWTILSAGVYTHTSDDRFAVLHAHGSDEWTLQLKYVTLKDNGTYECQVHTGSGFLSQFINLHIVIPTAFILGGTELHISSGDPFTLVCIIKQTLSPRTYVMWYHGDRIVNYADDRPRLKVDTSSSGRRTQSRLAVVNAKFVDSGNYTCMSNNAIPASVMVFVSEGDTVAAVQRKESNEGSSPRASLALWQLPLLLLLMPR